MIKEGFLKSNKCTLFSTTVAPSNGYESKNPTLAVITSPLVGF